MERILKIAREQKKLLVKDVAQALKIDQALVSKFESGTRRPTKEQVYKLAEILDLDANKLMAQWLKDRIIKEIGYGEIAIEALQLAEEEVKYISKSAKRELPKSLKKILADIDKLKSEVDKFRQFDSYRIAQALELEYTYESNRIEGNTLTLKETDLVVNEGLTISGKSMREHLEAINHNEAVDYIKELIKKNVLISERELLSIHQLILKSIDPENAGKYRNVQVMIKGSKHSPPQAFLVPKQMEDFFIWYNENKTLLHPVVLAAEVHERVVTIHPFIDGNGRTSRLLMNMILLKHGYVIANIKGDVESRMAYYNALEKAQTTLDKSDFFELVATEEYKALERYLKIVKGN